MTPIADSQREERFDKTFKVLNVGSEQESDGTRAAVQMLTELVVSRDILSPRALPLVPDPCLPTRGERRRSVILERLGIDQDERHAAESTAPIRPRVVRPALNQHVTGSHEGLSLV